MYTKNTALSVNSLWLPNFHHQHRHRHCNHCWAVSSKFDTGW